MYVFYWLFIHLFSIFQIAIIVGKLEAAVPSMSLSAFVIDVLVILHFLQI